MTEREDILNQAKTFRGRIDFLPIPALFKGQVVSFINKLISYLEKVKD